MTQLAAEDLIMAPPTFDLSSLRRERIATQCVCCGAEHLESSPAVLMPFVAHRVFGWTPVEIDESWGLRTVRSGMAYSVCNTRRCRVCNHLFCDIRFSETEMANLYDRYREEAYTSLRDHYEPGYAARNKVLNEAAPYLAEIERFVIPFVQQPLTVLDWGGDTGINTPFREKGAEIDIYDISNKSVLAGVRAVDRATALSKHYALVVCSMVLEHIPFPSDILLDTRNVMDGRSVLYIEVPYEEVVRTSIPLTSSAKKHWHEHINFYSLRSLACLVQNCGFEVLATNVVDVSVAGSSAHVLQMACKLA